MKLKTHTRIDVGPDTGRWVRISRKQVKCAAAWKAVQEAFKKKINVYSTDRSFRCL